MRIVIIANPNAGRARSAPHPSSFERALRSIGWDAVVRRTRSRGDAARLAATLGADADVLGVIGGDGTLHEVVNGMMTKLPQPIPLVLIPYGAGNDLASLIDCPR
ncbi:MAG: acylglycerol kinase family protein, partial [bacterium]